MVFGGVDFRMTRAAEHLQILAVHQEIGTHPCPFTMMNNQIGC